MYEKNLLTTYEAAHYLGMSMAFLERDRWEGAKIPFIRIGKRTIRYRKKALDEYIESKNRRSTSDRRSRK
ncbi:MAG: helix-turn-helix domain-containing protein [Candidatus Thiodiazotropha taylori]